MFSKNRMQTDNIDKFKVFKKKKKRGKLFLFSFKTKRGWLLVWLTKTGAFYWNLTPFKNFHFTLEMKLVSSIAE